MYGQSQKEMCPFTYWRAREGNSECTAKFHQISSGDKKKNYLPVFGKFRHNEVADLYLIPSTTATLRFSLLSKSLVTLKLLHLEYFVEIC